MTGCVSYFLTIISIFCELSPIVAVIVAVPAAFAVTRPVADTFATDVFELFHATLSSVEAERAVPSCNVLPAFIVRVRLLILTSEDDDPDDGYVAVSLMFPLPETLEDPLQ